MCSLGCRGKEIRLCVFAFTYHWHGIIHRSNIALTLPILHIKPIFFCLFDCLRCFRLLILCKPCKIVCVCHVLYLVARHGNWNICTINRNKHLTFGQCACHFSGRNNLYRVLLSFFIYDIIDIAIIERQHTFYLVGCLLGELLTDGLLCRLPFFLCVESFLNHENVGRRDKRNLACLCIAYNDALVTIVTVNH